MALERIEEAQEVLMKAARLDSTDGAILRELELCLLLQASKRYIPLISIDTNDPMTDKMAKLKEQENKRDIIQDGPKNEFSSELKDQIETLRHTDYRKKMTQLYVRQLTYPLQFSLSTSLVSNGWRSSAFALRSPQSIGVDNQ